MSTKQSINVVMIEDDDDFVEMIRTAMEAENTVFNYRVISMNTIRMAAAILRNNKEKVHLILLDLHLPNGEGVRLVTYIKSIVPDVPLVIVTGLDDEVVAIQALRELADDYLVKGRLTMDAILERIRNTIIRSQAKQALRAHLGPVESALEQSIKECEESDHLPPYKDSVAVSQDDTIISPKPPPKVD